MAAKFEFEDLKDVSSARALLQQGLRTNSQARLLWQEVRVVSISQPLNILPLMHRPLLVPGSIESCLLVLE